MTAPAVGRDVAVRDQSRTAPPARARRPALVVAAALGVLAVVGLLSLAVGARPVAPGTVVEALTSYDATDGDHAVVRARVPRTLVAVAVGAALGLAGAAMQGVTRNPLADPGILGVNAGAALAVVVGSAVLGVGSVGGSLWFAFVGAAAAAVAVYAVAGLARGGPTPVTLALAGAALTAGLVSVTNAVLVVDQETWDAFRRWQVGSVAGRSLAELGSTLPFLAVGAVVALGAGRALNGLALGDDVARGLGQRVGAVRAVVVLAIVLLCGAATALAGPIVFVGLVVPHAARAVVGVDYRAVLALSAVLAPGLLLVADVVGRVVLPPGEVPAGVLCALLGAPVFVWLVARSRAVAL